MDCHHLRHPWTLVELGHCYSHRNKLGVRINHFQAKPFHRIKSAFRIRNREDQDLETVCPNLKQWGRSRDQAAYRVSAPRF